MSKFVNDVDHLYDQLVAQDSNGRFICPVCEKDYATRAGIHKHLAARDCAPTSLLFEGTVTEDVGLTFYQKTVGEFNPRARGTLIAFRKSRYYSAVLKFVLHCMNNKVDSEMFFYWIKAAKRPRYYNQALSMGMKDSMLVEFRDHLIKNPELIDSESFFEQHRERLLSDNVFLTRALERGDISLPFCMNHPEINLNERVDNFDDGSRIRVLAVLKVIGA